MRQVAVLGTGSWGTAFSAVLADAGGSVRLWGRRPEQVASIARHRANLEYLPDLRLPDQVRPTGDIEEALEGADLVVIAVPSQTLRESLTRWTPHLPGDALVVSLIKGIEMGTGLRMTQIIGEVAGVPPERLAVVTGPNLAAEVAAHQPAASIVAARDERVAEAVAQACATPYFRPYLATDVIGAEIGGAVKNVIAVAVGCAEGMGLGDNTKATIITRGLAEITRLGLVLGADPDTFLGLAGVGDIIATCMSPLSRNHRVGVRLGRGESLDEIFLAIRQTAEGVACCEAVLALARRHGVDTPIVESVVAIVHDGQPPALVANSLMLRERKSEML